MKNLGGRLPKNKDFIIAQRRKIVLQLLAEKWSKADISRLFNVDKSQITRV